MIFTVIFGLDLINLALKEEFYLHNYTLYVLSVISVSTCTVYCDILTVIYCEILTGFLIVFIMWFYQVYKKIWC